MSTPVNPYAPPVAALASPPPPSPLSARNLAQLFFAPSSFFGNEQNFGSSLLLKIAFVIVGTATAIDRFDRQLIKMEMRGHDLTPIQPLTENWLAFWPLMVGTGLFVGAMIWYIGGWWYRVRLRWSGAVDPDPRRARVVVIFTNLVSALPHLLMMLGITLFYSGYLSYWRADEAFTGVVVIFPFWSIVVSYRAATTAFELRKWPARIWFLVLPILVSIVALGAIAVLLALFS